MKPIALLSTLVTLTLAATSQAQVIGTYRPSITTYRSTVPAVAMRPASYSTRVTTANYTTPVTAPVTTVGSPQVVNSYYPQSHVVGSPVAGGACNCGPVAPTVAYQGAPCAAPAVTAYSPGPGLPDGRYISRNLWGSPKVYGSGQPVRNLLRYLGP